jgi:serine O-acetyltransferase
VSGDANAPVEHGREAISEAYPPGGAAAGRSFREVLAIMREDWETHSRDLTQAGLHALLVQRYGAWQLSLRPGPRRTALSALRRACSTFMRNVYGIDLQDTARIGRRVRIGHHGPIIVGGAAVVGDGCLIRQNVTIGLSQTDSGSPRLGRNVQNRPGADIVGDVTIGDGARIGPNAVVIVDVPAGATAFAPPARQLPAKAAPAVLPAEEQRA